MLYENSDEPYCEEPGKSDHGRDPQGQPHRHDDKAAQGDRGYAGFSAGEGEKGHNQKRPANAHSRALRIDVNQEFEVLYEFMEKLPGALRPGGRVAISHLPLGGGQACETGAQRGI